MTQQPIESYSNEWHFLPQKLVDIAPVKAASEAPEGMKKITGGLFRFRVSGIEIEGHDDVGVDIQYQWEASTRRYHDHVLKIPDFWMDTNLVTNAQFYKFMQETHYRPADPINFLRDWKEGKYPEGWVDKPVTWISLEDARAYAHWAGSASLANGSGSMRPRAPTAGDVRGGMIGMPKQYRHRTEREN